MAITDPNILNSLLKARTPKAKKKQKPIAKQSEKKKKQVAEEKRSGTDGQMDLFFLSLRKSMTGKCLFCNGKSQKHDDQTFHFSLAHLFPKAIFPSVATHSDNVIELCFYENSCHTQFDNGRITWEFIKDSAEWELIKEKLLNVLPAIAIEERSHKLYSKVESLVYDKEAVK